jgi:hypothetical protein
MSTLTRLWCLAVVVGWGVFALLVVKDTAK